MRKAKHKGQHILAAALCVGLLAGMTPTQVFAEETPTAVVEQAEEETAPANEETPVPTEEPVEEATPAPTEEPDEETTPAPTETPAVAVMTLADESENRASVQAASDWFGKALEDNGGLTLANGAVTSTDSTWGTIFKVTAQWNNEGKYHATITDAKNLFGRTEFTLLADVKIEEPSSDKDKVAQRSAFTIDTGTNRLHLLTYNGKVGYGADSSSKGISENSIDLTTKPTVGTWSAVAFVYKEDGGNGTLTVYLDGKNVGQAADIGFKLSEASSLTALVARNVNTNFLMTGQYDNIVVESKALSEDEAIQQTAARHDAKSPVAMARSELTAKIAEIKEKLAADEANGIQYATEKLQSWQYTGGKSVTEDTLPELKETLAQAETLVNAEDADADAMTACTTALDTQYSALRTQPETYTSFSGTPGDVIKADTGLPMQAHGGSATALQEGTGDGCVNYDLDGDGEITEGKTVYLWIGEDKTNNTRPVDGVRCYSSTDLYNWTDRGTILYTQSSILPVELTDTTNLVKFSEKNLETLKAWGKQSTAPEGVTESEFRNVKNFLRPYVTEYEKAPTDANDISWVAKSYDETQTTATSLLYPNSADKTVRNVQTTRLQLAFETLYGNYCVTERPKMVYNEKTKKFVLIWHADGPLYDNDKLYSWVQGGCVGKCEASRYGRAAAGFATSDSPFGPFTVQTVTRMNYDTKLNGNLLGMARDMAVFVDSGVDKNNDGVEDAYMVYSSEENQKLYVSLLNADYTGPIAADDTANSSQYAARIVGDVAREAPAVFKYDGWYYLLTSGTHGWDSTAHTYYRSQDMLSGWEKVGDPAKNGSSNMFDTQVTYILPVDAEKGKFIYMGDRWNGDNLTDSRTIWLPMQVDNGSHTVAVFGESNWTLDRLDQLLPMTLNTKLPDVVWLDGSNLPETVNVTYQGTTMDSKVEWDTTALKNFATTTITGTLTDCGNATVSATVMVVPKNLVYFTNPSQTPVSSDYTAIMNANKATLKQDATVNDGAYSAEAGFGYQGVEGTVRKNNDDIYNSLRYASSKNSITYQFDGLTDSDYTVYVGMFNPTGWDGTRLADIKINSAAVQTYSYTNCNGIGDTLTFAGVQPAEDGTLTVEIARNAKSAKDVQVSFIMVAGKAVPTADTEIRAEEGLTTVPAGVADKFDTVEAIEAELKQQLSGVVSDGDVTVYDVKLMVKYSDDTWQEADPEDFPEEGMDVYLPLPAGVEKDTFDQYDIAVAHMLCTGADAGKTEFPAVTLEQVDGVWKLKVHVASLSPFAVSCKKKAAPTNPDDNKPNQPDQPSKPDDNKPSEPEQPSKPDDTKPTQPDTKPDNGGSTNNNTNSTTNTTSNSTTNTTTAKTESTAKNKAVAPAATNTIPKTADNFPLIPVLGVALASLAALCVLFIRRRKGQ